MHFGNKAPNITFSLKFSWRSSKLMGIDCTSNDMNKRALLFRSLWIWVSLAVLVVARCRLVFTALFVGIETLISPRSFSKSTQPLVAALAIAVFARGNEISCAVWSSLRVRHQMVRFPHSPFRSICKCQLFAAVEAVTATLLKNLLPCRFRDIAWARRVKVAIVLAGAGGILASHTCLCSATAGRRSSHRKGFGICQN